MDDKHFEAKDDANQVRGILQKAVQFCKEGKHLQAAQLLKKGLEIYPGQKEFLNLLGQLRGQIDKLKVESVEKEAFILIQSGDVDEAQIKFRQILQIDPTRTDLQHSIEKTSKERREEITRQNRRTEIMRYSTYMVLIVAALLLVFFIWAGWENKKHINEAKQFIEKRQYEKAQQALQNCGWFMAKEKKHVRQELKKIADEKWEEAQHLGDIKEYEKAMGILKIALTASDTPAMFEEQIVRFKELNRLKIEAEKAAQAALEAEQAVFEAALQTKRACEQAAQAARASNAETDAEELWREAEQLATSTDKLIEAKRFAEAQKVWNEAAGKYEEAKATAKAVGEQRQMAFSARDKCRKALEIAKQAFAQNEASELWQEAGRIASSAEKYVNLKKFAEAQQAWLEAAEKYGQALDVGLQSPSYKKALLKLKKWQNLKAGIDEQDVKKNLGLPKRIQAASDECIWYYQCFPKLITKSNGEKKCVEPKFGFVRFTNESSKIIRERMERAYNMKVKKENSQYEHELDKMRIRHEEQLKLIRHTIKKRRVRDKALEHENMLYDKNVSKVSQKHQDRLSEIKQKYSTNLNRLAKGLTEIEPIYVVSEWKEPEQADMINLVSNQEAPKKGNSSQAAKWQVPLRWRKLKLNMSEKDVHRMIGFPEETKSNNNQRIEFYGDVHEYGVVVFTEREGSSRGLSYWKEPLWSVVKGELSSESTTQEYITNKSKNLPNKPASLRYKKNSRPAAVRVPYQDFLCAGCCGTGDSGVGLFGHDFSKITIVFAFTTNILPIHHSRDSLHIY